MDASRVVVSREKTMYKPLTYKQKVNLKREAVKALIQSRPFMSRIKTKEFANVLHTTEAGAYQFLQTMLKKKQILKHNLSQKTFAYTIPGEVRVTKPAFPTLVKPEDSMEPDKETANAIEQAAKSQEDNRYKELRTVVRQGPSVRRLAERYFVESFGDKNFERFVEWCDKQ